MKDVSQILKSLGLIDSEIKTYLQALQHGPSTVLDLSKYTELSRQATYLAIESLSKRGLMSSVARGKKSYYAAEAPAKLLSYAKRAHQEMEQRISDLAKIVPDLELRVGGDKPAVRVYEGKDGVRAMLEDFKNTKPEFLDEFSDLEAVFGHLTLDDLASYRTVLKQSKTKIRSIYAGETKTSSIGKNRHLMPDKYKGFRTNIAIHPDRVTFVTFGDKMFSIMIENKWIAQAMHYLFDIAKQSPVLKKDE